MQGQFFVMQKQKSCTFWKMQEREKKLLNIIPRYSPSPKEIIVSPEKKLLAIINAVDHFDKYLYDQCCIHNAAGHTEVPCKRS